MQNPGFRFWVLLDVWPSKHTRESYKKFAHSCYTQNITSIPLYIQTTCISVELYLNTICTCTYIYHIHDSCK